MLTDKILVINTGSSSIKFQLFIVNNNEPVCFAKGLVERIGITDSKIVTEINENGTFQKYLCQKDLKNHEEAAQLVMEQLISLKVINNFNEITGVGHRVVHGGEHFINSTIINQEVENDIAACITLAPLHNPAALKGYCAFKELNPSLKHVAVFDTAFHNTLSPEKYLYSVPYQWYQDYHVRRYGFHGISYRYIVNKIAAINGTEVTNVNAIICHLGNGASICAVKNGKSINTSMGLTPLDGLIMGTRSGIIDPSIHQYVREMSLKEEKQLDLAAITTALNQKSGLFGISNGYSDLRDVIKISEDQCHQDQKQAQLALTMFVERIANYIIQYANDLGNKVNSIIFTAGIGENSALVRKLVIDKIKVMNLKINENKNESSYDDYLLISEPASQVRIYKIRTNEELIICHDTLALIK